MKIRKEVIWFARQMEKVLRDNDDKGHWSGCSSEYLQRRMREEIVELENSWGQGCNATIHEAVDVANFVMMIADNARQQGRCREKGKI